MTAASTRSWFVLAGLTLGVCVTNGFARFAYGLILPAMKEDLGWTYAEAGWLNTANAFGYILGSFLTFALVRRMPSSRLFSLGMLGTSIFLLATGFTDDFTLQSLWRILTGVFGAVAFITGGALSASLFQEDRKLNALSITVYFGIGGGLGMVLSGAVLPSLFDIVGPSAWPTAWILLGGASLLFCPLCIWASESLRPPVRGVTARPSLPVSRMWAEIAGYLCFGLGYIVYVTFVVALMQKQSAGPLTVSLVWVVIGLGIMLSPFVWKSLFARYASGLPLAMILAVMALGTVFPVLAPSLGGLLASAALFGLSVFMAPGAVTNFSRKNLPTASWAAAISLFTILFSIGQTVGPVAAGMLGDHVGDIGLSILSAGVVLALGAGIACLQRPLSADAA